MQAGLALEECSYKEINLLLFFSEKLHGPSLNYSTYDKELYALV
jgi:hypothetical protein